MRRSTIALGLAALMLAVPAWAGKTSDNGASAPPKLRSSSVLVVDQEQGEVIFGKNVGAVQPIASITKLMTAMVVLDAKLPLDESIEIVHDDLDFVKGTHSRLQVGTVLTRGEMLKLALMASENRAAAALGRSYPGGIGAFVEAMNRKAAELGMNDTRFVDSTGLNPQNVSTAQDLVKLVEAGYSYEVIRDFTTSESHIVEVEGRSRNRLVSFNNSNRLVRSSSWDIGLSKTGYISEAGRCLVMQAKIAARPVIIVLLDSWGKLSRIADANRIKQLVEAELKREAKTRGLRRVADDLDVVEVVFTRAAASSRSRARSDPPLRGSSAPRLSPAGSRAPTPTGRPPAGLRRRGCRRRCTTRPFSASSLSKAKPTLRIRSSSFVSVPRSRIVLRVRPSRRVRNA